MRPCAGLAGRAAFGGGAVVLLYPALSNLYYQRQCAQAAETFAQGQSEAENAALWQAAEAYNMALAEKAEQFALTAEEPGADCRLSQSAGDRHDGVY